MNELRAITVADVPRKAWDAHKETTNHPDGGELGLHRGVACFHDGYARGWNEAVARMQLNPFVATARAALDQRGDADDVRIGVECKPDGSVTDLESDASEEVFSRGVRDHKLDIYPYATFDFNAEPPTATWRAVERTVTTWKTEGGDKSYTKAPMEGHTAESLVELERIAVARGVKIARIGNAIDMLRTVLGHNEVVSEVLTGIEAIVKSEEV